MTEKENERLKVMNALLEGEINGTEASKKLGLTVRQIRRIKSSYSLKGALGIAHGLRGRVKI